MLYARARLGAIFVPLNARMPVFNHQNLTLGALKMISDDGLTGDDEVLVASPLFHVAALLSLALPSLWAGATRTIHRLLDAACVLENLQRRRCQQLPTSHARFCGDPGRSVRCESGRTRPARSCLNCSDTNCDRLSPSSNETGK
jgi:acyl-CoA synthetase (AMP-forming)/AMP-acid ligase II